MSRPKIQRQIPASVVEGSAYLLGDFIDADAIIPVKYCTRPAPEILVKRCLTQIDADFPAKARRGLILIAGKDFGRGSANENSVRALQLSGVKAVVALSFGLLFKRNAINLGLPVLECKEMIVSSETGDRIEIDLENWICANLTAGIEAGADSISEIERAILGAGGAIEWIRKNKSNTNREALISNELQ